MKSKLILEIETPDKPKVFIEEGQSNKDYEGVEKQKELKEFRSYFAAGLHKSLVEYIKKHFAEEIFEEDFLNDCDEFSVDSWYSFKDYGIKIKVTQPKKGQRK